MDGLDIGTLYAILKIDDSGFSSTLEGAEEQLADFGEAGTFTTDQLKALPSVMTDVATSTAGVAASSGEAAIKQAALKTETAAVGLAAAGGVGAQTAFSAAMLDSADSSTVAKQMMAEMTAAAEANRPATAAVATAHTELAVVLQTATLAWEAIAVPLGLVTIAVAAFGPKLWEMAGGWDGVKAAGAEAYSVLSDLGVILGAIGGHVLNSVIEGVTATAHALATVGGAAVDAVKWFGDIFGIWSSIGAIYGGVVNGIHAVAEALRAANAELPDAPAGFQAPKLSFGIDPNNDAAVAAWIAQNDAQIAASNRLRDSQVQLKDASKMTFDELLRWAGSSVIAGGIEDVELEARNLTHELTQMGATMSLVTAPGIQNMNASLTEAGGSVGTLIPSTNTLTSALMGLPVQPVTQDVSQAVYAMQTWDQQINGVALSFLQLGQIIPGVTGSVLTFIGSALNGFLTLTNVVQSLPGYISQIGSGGFGNILGGITGIMGAASTAIGIFSALGSAIKRAFTSEETELVNPNRDLFFGQFLGADTDPFQALGNALNTAAMRVYGVDWNTAWTQYGEPLIGQLYQADTYGEFQAAQLAIGELFKRAGVTIDIFNEAGIGTAYQSSVFDSASSYQIPTSQAGIAQFGQTVTTQVGQQVLSGGTMFQGGTPIGMSNGGMCVQIQTANFYGANAKELGTAFLEWLKNGGDGMSSFRDVVCAANA